MPRPPCPCSASQVQTHPLRKRPVLAQPAGLPQFSCRTDTRELFRLPLQLAAARTLYSAVHNVLTSVLALQVYGLLQRHVERGAFLKQLELAKVAQGSASAGAIVHGSEVLRETWWEPPAGEGCATDAADPAVVDAGFTEVCSTCEHTYRHRQV